MRMQSCASVLLALVFTVAVAASPQPAKPLKAAPAKTAKAVPEAPRDYRIAAAPAWVREAPAAEAWTPPPGGKARRAELWDLQLRLGEPEGPVRYTRMRQVALDASTLREVAEPQIGFNPAFQRVVLHRAEVRRHGVVEDRLKSARIETLRREQGLEMRMLDGQRTLLLVLADVRVGDAVDVAWSVVGDNPIFEGQIADTFDLADDAPVDLLRVRVDAPASLTLQQRLISMPGGSNLQPQLEEQAGRRLLTWQRSKLAAVIEEQQVPPWVKQYPALQISSWSDWAAVNAWAQRLFAAQPADEALKARAAAIRAAHATPEAQVAEALRFVQDEVRYFSLSLGESSHRPKPASRTLADRLGDCKDKVLLFNALLAELGIEAQPALVSVRRNRGLTLFLPSHDQLDHAISRVKVGERWWLLDPTIANQGLGLRERGHHDYGQALLVGGPAEPQRVAAPADAPEGLRWEQRWNFAELRQGAQLELVFSARGLAAEGLRAAVAAMGSERWIEQVRGGYQRLRPGLQLQGEPQLKDDRERNELRLQLSFRHPQPGAYQGGQLAFELPVPELTDTLALPSEDRRRQALLNALAGRAEHVSELRLPQPMTQTLPPPTQLGHKAFAVQARWEQVEPTLLRYSVRLDRRADEILPADMDSYREAVSQARRQLGLQMRMPLFDVKRLPAEFARVAELSAALGRPGFLNAPDGLHAFGAQLARLQIVHDLALEQLGRDGPLAAAALAQRGASNNMLARYELALTDAEAADKADAQLALAAEVRGVALVALGRVAEAQTAFEQARDRQQASSGQVADVGAWLPISHYLQGRYAEAEAQLRQVLPDLQGRAREQRLLWLFLAAERQGGRGKAVLDEFPPDSGAQKDEELAWTLQLRRFLGGEQDAAALLAQARKSKAMERMLLCEAQYFVGALAAARGAPAAQVQAAFQQAAATQATPTREYILAQLALRR